MHPFGLVAVGLGVIWWLTRPKVPPGAGTQLPAQPPAKPPTQTPAQLPAQPPAQPSTQPPELSTAKPTQPAAGAQPSAGPGLKPVASPSRVPQDGFGIAGGTSGAVWWIGPIGESSGGECVWMVVSPAEVFNRAQDTNVLKYVGPCKALFPQGKVSEILTSDSALATYAIADIGLEFS